MVGVSSRNRLFLVLGLLVLTLLFLLTGCAKTKDIAAAEEGPPKIPHSIVAIENCLVCHETGLTGRAPITPHPERPGCTMCHQPKEV